MLDESRLRAIRSWLFDRPTGLQYMPRPYALDLQPLVGWRIPKVTIRWNHMPRWELEGSTYFITFKVTRELGTILRRGRSREILEEILFHDYRLRYDLDAYVVMPDHFHMLFRPFSGEDLGSLLKSLKGRTSRRINLALGRHGRLWQPRSFDRIIRSPREWLWRVHYIHQNPVRAKLVARAEDYAWSSLLTMHSMGRLESFPDSGPD